MTLPDPDARFSMLDALGDLVAPETRNSVARWLTGVPPDSPELRLMDAVVAEPDEAVAATMVFLLDSHLREATRVPLELRVQLLELLACGVITNLPEAIDPWLPPRPRMEFETVRTRDEVLSWLCVPNRGLRTAHPVYVAAFRASPRELQHTGAIHRGEPMPVPSQRAMVRFLASLADHLAPLATREERPEFDALVARGRPYVEGKKLAEDYRASGRKRAPMLTVASAAHRQAVARWAYATDKNETAIAAVSDAIPLAAQRGGWVAAEHLLAAIDEGLRRADVEGALEERDKAASAPLRRALFRGPELWMAELDSGALGLLRKEGRRWAWHEGAQDELLPLLPDAFFEAAALAACEPYDPARTFAPLAPVPSKRPQTKTRPKTEPRPKTKARSRR